MSSPASPSLTTDGLDRSLEQGVVIVSLVVAAGLPWAASGGRAPLQCALLAVTLVALVAAAWRLAGWLGGSSALRSAHWDSDGFWRLELADGSALEGRLTSGSRVVPPWVFLAWRTSRGRRSMLLCGTRRSVALRRLVVRLRLEAHAVPAAVDAPGTNP
jgi:hypothetical protein